MDLSWHQISPMVGYVLHVEAVKEVIDQFSNQSGGTYVLQSKEKRFGASDCKALFCEISNWLLRNIGPTVFWCNYFPWTKTIILFIQKETQA